MAFIAYLYGGEEIAAALRSMGRPEARGVVIPALREGMEEMAGAVRAEISGLTQHSGALLAGVKVLTGRGDRQDRFSVFIGSYATRKQFASQMTRAGRPGMAGAALASKSRRYAVYYGFPLEFGHKKVLWGRETEEMVAPHPWARPAFDSSVDSAVETAGESLLANMVDKF